MEITAGSQCFRCTSPAESWVVVSVSTAGLVPEVLPRKGAQKHLPQHKAHVYTVKSSHKKRLKAQLQSEQRETSAVVTAASSQARDVSRAALSGDFQDLKAENWNWVFQSGKKPMKMLLMVRGAPQALPGSRVGWGPMREGSWGETRWEGPLGPSVLRRQADRRGRPMRTSAAQKRDPPTQTRPQAACPAAWPLTSTPSVWLWLGLRLSFAPGGFFNYILFIYFLISSLLCLFAPGFSTEKWEVITASGMVVVMVTGETQQILRGKELSNPHLPLHQPF